MGDPAEALKHDATGASTRAAEDARFDACLALIAELEAADRFANALPVYDAALALRPGRLDIHMRRGACFERQGRWGEAAVLYGRLADALPTLALAHFCLGRALAALGHEDGAVSAYERALAIDPDMIEALSNLATLLAARGRTDRAAAAAGRAHALEPGNADVANNFAVVLQRGGRAAEAAEIYHRALALDPRHAGAWANLGIVLQELFRFDEALEALQRAVAIDPGFESAVVELVKVRRHVCAWDHFEDDRRTLLDLLERDGDATFMLLLMSFPTTPEQQLACARQQMRRLNARTAQAPPSSPIVGRRLRVGYLSHDFRDHPVGRLLPELLAQHDRATIEVSTYALGRDDPGRVRRRIARASDRFVDLHGVSDREAAQRIRDDGIDVLVDLTGPTTGARLDILAFRPASVQVSFLGWPGTTGADCIDYVVGDPVLIPAEHAPHYSERIVQLPQCYQPSDPFRAEVLPALTRSNCGLPEQAFVFCSFNNTSKLTPTIFDLWLRLLEAVPGSVLWLYCKTPRTIANLRARARRHGIAAERLVFAPVAAMDTYLARLRLADLFLDSYPYNAGATCNDALWMGLPVLTCAGDTYVSRMAASLLRAAGLPGLVAATLEAYEALAVRLARDPALIGAIRERLASARQGSALFDMPRFAVEWETALRHMHARSLTDGAAEGFAVGPMAA